MLISDNTKFQDFATKTFSISKENLDKFKVLYNPIKLDISEIVSMVLLTIDLAYFLENIV